MPTERKESYNAVSIAHARRIAACYSAHGLESVAIDSRTPASERKELVDDFRRGKVKVLVNVDIFSEGFDCPDVDSCSWHVPRFPWRNTCNR